MTAIEGALVDLDGTVYLGDRLLPGAAAGIEALEAAGVEPVFLSNNATKRPRAYRDKLARMGIAVDRERIMNSAATARSYLASTHPDANVYVIGEPPLVAELEAGGLTTTENPRRTDVVLASLDRSFDYADLEHVLVADDHGELQLYATNPDRTCPVEDGEIPDCGAVIGAIEGLLGREIDRVLGKPSRVTIDVALERVGVEPDACLVVGDRLETDIRMGKAAGLQTALVLTGVTDRSVLADAEIQPDYVLDSIAEVDEVIEL